VQADLNEHVDSRPDLHFLDDAVVALLTNQVNQLTDQAGLDPLVQDYVVLKLTGLHLFDWLQFDFRHVILIHVQ
jgi:hypothetical protein